MKWQPRIRRHLALFELKPGPPLRKSGWAAQLSALSLSALKSATALPESEFGLRARDRNYPWELPGLADPDS
jgi:hypothetical protein